MTARTGGAASVRRGEQTRDDHVVTPPDNFNHRGRAIDGAGNRDRHLLIRLQHRHEADGRIGLVRGERRGESVAILLGRVIGDAFDAAEIDTVRMTGLKTVGMRPRQHRQCESEGTKWGSHGLFPLLFLAPEQPVRTSRKEPG